MLTLTFCLAILALALSSAAVACIEVWRKERIKSELLAERLEFDAPLSLQTKSPCPEGVMTRLLSKVWFPPILHGKPVWVVAFLSVQVPFGYLLTSSKWHTAFILPEELLVT